MFSEDVVREAAQHCLAANFAEAGMLWLELPDAIGRYPTPSQLPHPSEDFAELQRESVTHTASAVVADILAYCSKLGISRRELSHEINAACNERDIPHLF